MRFSLNAMELCKNKLGRKHICGLDESAGMDWDTISEQILERNYKELLQNEILDVESEQMRINALGQFIFRMMEEPEQYIEINNPEESICIRVFIYDIYYLCMIENTRVTNGDDFNRFQIELLPNLELVVGAFTYGLKQESNKNRNDMGKTPRKRFTVRAVYYNQSHCLAKEMRLNGSLGENDAEYDVFISSEKENKVREHREAEVSELINELTIWMLQNFATKESEV